MCGRYVLNGTPDEVSLHFDVPVLDNFPARYNIAPTQGVAIIRAPEENSRRDKHHYQLVRWGFIPSWAGRAGNDSFTKKPLINARSETVAEKPSFRSAYKRRRCLVPANGFYEWKTINGRKIPHYFQLSNGALFAFAGIWETILDPGGGEMDTMAILTTAAGPDMRALHGREPVIIPQADYTRWLETDERDIAGLSSLLRPANRGVWNIQPVTTDVGNVRNEGARLIEPVGQLGLL